MRESEGKKLRRWEGDEEWEIRLGFDAAGPRGLGGERMGRSGPGKELVGHLAGGWEGS